ncbi:Hypothetical predicted protein [Scomber scombrus]|uniref:Uncharacterized protein n=1 Tax=Scomber scombrus TaxID=13677 RepID=A0AAV1Q4W1_SCOSC
MNERIATHSCNHVVHYLVVFANRNQKLIFPRVSEASDADSETERALTVTSPVTFEIGLNRERSTAEKCRVHIREVTG